MSAAASCARAPTSARSTIGLLKLVISVCTATSRPTVITPSIAWLAPTSRIRAPETIVSTGGTTPSSCVGTPSRWTPETMFACIPAQRAK